MKVKNVKIEDFSNHFDELGLFCRDVISDKKLDPAGCIATNMDVNSWEKNKASLLYKIFVSKSFTLLSLLYNDNNELIIVSAIEHAKFDSKVAIVAKRTYIKKEYRAKGLFSEYLLEKQIEWAKKNKYHTVLITIDEVMKGNVKLLKRAIKKGIISFKIPDSLKLFKEYPEKLYINYTNQHVFYYSLIDKEWIPPKSIRIKEK